MTCGLHKRVVMGLMISAGCVANASAMAPADGTIAITKDATAVALNPQPLPPGEHPADAVALNPQALPPVECKVGAVALNPQPLPPAERPGGAVALNPQPLPPGDRPADAVALNPQPLPPRECPAGPVALNPQPLPPVDRPAGAVALNPQPLPPVDGPGDAVALNPQPLPPLERPAGAVALNPQPLPPVDRPADAVALNPQPLPPVGGSFADPDIEALAWLVLRESSRSAQEDLRSVMESIRRINGQKADVRAALLLLREEQDGARETSDARAEQRRWGRSLARLCPPGNQQDECLSREILQRAQLIRSRSTQ